MNSEWYSGRFRKLDAQTGYLLVSMFATGNLEHFPIDFTHSLRA